MKTKKNKTMKQKTTLKITKKIVKITKKKKKKKSSIFFKKYRTSENMYIADKNITEDFGENKIFANSYFYRTHIQWNNLPLEIKIIENYDEFKIKLERHLWEYIIEDEECDDQEFMGVPGD